MAVVIVIVMSWILNLLVSSGEGDADGSGILKSVTVELLDGLFKTVPVEQLRGRVVAGSSAGADRVSLLKTNLKFWKMINELGQWCLTNICLNKIVRFFIIFVLWCQSKYSLDALFNMPYDVTVSLPVVPMKYALSCQSYYALCLSYKVSHFCPKVCHKDQNV